MIGPRLRGTVFRRRTAVSTCIAAFLLPGSLVAEPLQRDQLEVIHVTAHRITQALDEIPASVGVIDHEQLRSLQAYTLSDIFRYEPGVTVERTGHRFGDANINIRGIGGNRVLLLQDGVRMPSGFGSAGSDQGRGSLNPINLERIEVLKGAASALYGSDALGGVVLFETLDAERLVSANSGGTHLQLITGYDSADERSHATATVASEVGAGYGLLQVDYQDFSEPDVNSDFDPNPVDGTVESVLGKWSMSTAQNVHWDFIADYWRQEADHNLLTNRGPVSGPPGAHISDSVATDDSDRWRLGVHITLENLWGLDSLHWQLDYQESAFEQFESELLENAGSAFPPIPASAERTTTREWFDQQQWSFSLRGHRSFNQHDVVAGIDWLSKDFSQLIDSRSFDVLQGVAVTGGGSVAYPGRSFPNTRVDQAGFYVQDQWQASDRLDILAGLRYDYFESEPESDAAYERFNLSGTPVESRSDGEWSPHLGLTYQFTDRQQVYASYQTGFRAPPVDDQYISRAILIPVPGVPHEVIPSSDLGPETSTGYELGWRWHGPVLSASVAYYDTDYEDFIDTQTVGYREQPPVFVGPTAIRQLQYQNVDEVEIAGVEVKSTLNLNSWVDMAWHARVLLGANFIEAENKATGDGLNSVGPDTLNLGVQLASPAENLGFSWMLRAAASADDAEPLQRQGQVLQPFEPPGYGVHDFTVFWQISDQLRLDAAVYNVFDKQYWGAHAKGSDAGGNLDADVEPGRTFAVNLAFVL